MPRVIDIDQLFETVVRVFAERGYTATTTQEIARQAGVSEVTLYRRHGSKAALIAAALCHVLERSPFGSVVPSGELRDDLLAIVRAYVDTNRAYGAAVVTLLTELPRHPELREALSALLPNLQHAAQLVASHQARGDLLPGDPLQQVSFLLAPVIAGAMWGRLGAAPSHAVLSPEVIVDRFLDGHRARSGPARAHGTTYTGLA